MSQPAQALPQGLGLYYVTLPEGFHSLVSRQDICIEIGGIL